MPGVYKRKSDKARGKSGKWTCWYAGADGKRHTCPGVTDKARSLEIAQHREAEERRVREGITDPAERTRREASLRGVADHVESYRLDLVAKGDSRKHCTDAATMLLAILEDAAVSSVADIDAAAVQQALGRLRAVPRSARTCNKALGFVKAFAAWLELNNRIKEVPRALAKIPRYNEAADRKYERRALTKPELDRLLKAAESGPPVVASRGPRKGPRVVVEITGPERAALYRLAMGTGFRAEELRTLTPERFALDGNEPTVTVLACYAKNGKLAVQPVTRELAAGLKPFVDGKEPGKPVIRVPDKTARMLRRDLAAAEIPVRTAEGVLDFHALRASYITHLIQAKKNPRVVQRLARHSTITLTLERYTKVSDDDLRAALEEGDGR